MHYLIVDPIGTYAERQKLFLDRLGLPAIAVFTNEERLLAWQRKWRFRLGELVAATFVLGEGENMRDLAAQIAREFGAGGFYGVVPWDEMHVLFAAELGELLDLGWNCQRGDRALPRQMADEGLDPPARRGPHQRLAHGQKRHRGAHLPGRGGQLADRGQADRRRRER